MPRTPRLDIGPPRDPADLRGYFDVIVQAFPMAFTADQEEAWLQREDPAGMRVARRGGRVVGGLMLLDVGQWFGGRSVPMGGLRAVGVRPEERGGGVASRLVRAALDELYARGVPLSTLYPATQPVYRRQGYEQAGLRQRYAAPADAFGGVAGGDLAVEPVDESQQDDLHAVYTRRAARTAGHLDRDAGCWKRIFAPRGKRARGFRFAGPQGTEGYLFTLPEMPPERRYTLAVTDLVVLTPAAARAALDFLARHRSLAGKVAWVGAPQDPLLTLFVEQRWEIVQHELWMLRLVDVRRALAARGWPAEPEGVLHLAVQDDILPWNDGRFVLEVCKGEAQVRKGGRGRLRVDVRALAALYSGHLTPEDLRLAGALDGPAADLATAARLFAGPAPWMPDFF